MSKVIITSQKLVSLADAVRTHNSISDKLKLPDIPGMVGVNLAPGTYDANGVMLKSWDRLIDDGDINANEGTLYLAEDPLDPKDTTMFDPYGREVRFSDVDTLVVSNSITAIGRQGFASSPFKHVIIPDSVISIGESAFVFNFNLTEIQLPNGITSIEKGLFSQCNNLTNVVIPPRVTNIGELVFSYCKFAEITIPDSVTSINDTAFNACDNLTKIYYKGTATGAPWGATNATVITDF